jgi:YHYH protein/type IX secretion system substrate protein
MIKQISSIITATVMAFSAQAQVGPNISSWIINTTGATGYNSLPSNVQQVQYNTTDVYVSASCIPGYAIGPWNSNPNTPSNQNFVYAIPLNPVQNTGTAITTPMGHTGVWSNGVSIFNPKDGYYWNNSTGTFVSGGSGTWNRNALVYEGVSFDNCLGHPQQNGEYHLHVNPKCLYDDTDSTHHSPIIGYAFDGFPVYGAYAYTNTNGTGAIKRMVSSYTLSTATTRTNGPPVNATYPLGNMCEDYIYTAGAGDLDVHNGRFCVTPDYPSGIYAYFVTIDNSLAPAYPFVLGPTYYGTVPSGNTGPTSGHNTPTGTVTTYSPTTGIAKTEDKISALVYPNPTSDYLFLFINPIASNNFTATLTDVQGRVVLTKENIQPTISYSFDLTQIPKGMYLLRLKNDSKEYTEKVIVK